MGFKLPNLPPDCEIETKAILKKAVIANRYLAELKGVLATIPNQAILINTLSLQEAKDSSAIENIITTHDELFKEKLFPEYASNVAAKEVENYVSALKIGFNTVKEQNLLTNNHILQIQAKLEKNKAGFRKLPGTELKNDQTGETIYTPPQNHSDIINLMTNLEQFINNDSFYDADSLVKMAIIHYQFESIHPFYDGNGRTGRIINVLYLVQKELLNIPVLYLSRYIVQNKSEYYRRLQAVRDSAEWESWVLYMLDGVEKTAIETIKSISMIRDLMLQFKHEIREKYKFYSQDLLNNLFSNPYTKIDFLVRDLGVTRKTASKYLDELANGGFLHKEKIGNSSYYINVPLLKIFTG